MGRSRGRSTNKRVYGDVGIILAFYLILNIENYVLLNEPLSSFFSIIVIEHVLCSNTVGVAEGPLCILNNM